jgi:hypothetical protein
MPVRAEQSGLLDTPAETDRDAGSWDIEVALYKAVKTAFPKGKITIEHLTADHPKLAPRQLPPQIMVKVAGLTQWGLDESENVKKQWQASVATMVPEDGDQKAIEKAITELNSQRNKIERDTF